VDLQEKKYIQNDEMARGDCSPSWAPDGSYIITTARTTSRPVLRADFNAAAGTIAPSEYFIGLYTIYQYYIHGQRVSNDGKWVVYGGVYKGTSPANLKEGGREIYCWKIGEAESKQVQLTFDTEEDHQPDLYIPEASGIGSLPDNRALTGPEGDLLIRAGAQEIVITCSAENITGQLAIYSVTGNRLAELRMENSRAVWQCGGPAAGLYLFTLQSGSLRIIKKHLLR